MEHTPDPIRAAVVSEAELVHRACAGCRVSFDELVRQIRPRLLRFLRRWAADESTAEDLTQDTFTRAYENLGRYDKRWRFTTWLFTIGRRIAIDQSRRRRTIAQPTEGESAGPMGYEPMQRLMIEEQRRELWRIVDLRLAGAQAEALWLRYGESMGVAEIAKVMGKTQVGVRVTLLRARKALAPHVRMMAETERSDVEEQEEAA